MEIKRHIYIRNDLHINRLGKEEKEIINKGFDLSDQSVSQKAEQTIEHTFPKVIAYQEIKSEEDKKSIINLDF